MRNLTWKSVSVMKKTRESSSSQISLIEKQNLIARLATTGITHIEITMLAEDNANLVSHGFVPSPRTIEAETQQWYDVIHAQPNIYGPSVYGGYLKVYDRAVFCGIEGILGFSHDTTTPVGTFFSSKTDGNSTWCGRYYNYLLNHVTAAKIESGDIQCPIPEITGPAFSGQFFTTQSGAHTCVSEFRKIALDFWARYGKTVTYLNNPNFSEVASGWWGGSAFSETGIVCYDYYGGLRGSAATTPLDYYYDLNQVYLGISPNAGYGISSGGYPQFIGEWGDLSGSIRLDKGSVRSGDNFVAGTTNEIDWQLHLFQHFKQIKRLVDENKLDGYNWWGGWESQNTSLLWKTGSGDSSQYYLNWRGQLLAQFYINDGPKRLPVITGGGAYSESSTSFGGRNRYA